MVGYGALCQVLLRSEGMFCRGRAIHSWDPDLHRSMRAPGGALYLLKLAGTAERLTKRWLGTMGSSQEQVFLRQNGVASTNSVLPRGTLRTSSDEEVFRAFISLEFMS